nr:DUF6286 domain-containing protein [Streptomyces globisporus]
MQAAVLILRDRAVRVSGVESARVDVGRRKIKVQAQVHFRDLDEVRADLGATLGEAVTSLGLVRQPTLTVRVRRSKKTDLDPHDQDSEPGAAGAARPRIVRLGRRRTTGRSRFATPVGF